MGASSANGSDCPINRAKLVQLHFQHTLVNRICARTHLSGWHLNNTLTASRKTARSSQVKTALTVPEAGKRTMGRNYQCESWDLRPVRRGLRYWLSLPRWPQRSSGISLNGPMKPLGHSDSRLIQGYFGKNLKLVSTMTFRRNFNGAPFTGGIAYSIHDKTGIMCPQTPAGNCVVVAKVNVQMAGIQDDDGNPLAMCVLMDNKSMQPSSASACPYVGVLNELPETRDAVFIQYGVAPGPHLVQAGFGSEDGGVGGLVSIVYEVYK